MSFFGQQTLLYHKSGDLPYSFDLHSLGVKGAIDDIVGRRLWMKDVQGVFKIYKIVSTLLTELLEEYFLCLGKF